MINYINNKILTLSKDLKFSVADRAPSTELELFTSTGLVIWSGGSETTIYQDAKVNYAFRALHDDLHLQTGLGFSPEEEIIMGRIQAASLGARCESLLADLVYIEVARQAEYYKTNGVFISDQINFTKVELAKLNIRL